MPNGLAFGADKPRAFCTSPEVEPKPGLIVGGRSAGESDEFPDSDNESIWGITAPWGAKVPIPAPSMELPPSVPGDLAGADTTCAKATAAKGPGEQIQMESATIRARQDFASV